MSDLRTKVFSNLDSAEANGYFDPGEQLDGVTADEIADDMIALAEDCESSTQSELLPFVEEWLAMHGRTQPHKETK